MSFIINQKEQRITEPNELFQLLDNVWFEALKSEFTKDYWENIVNVLNHSRYLPRKKDIFNALNTCPPNKVKVVIIGQDPYIHANEAHGFSFSVPNNTPVPPSLRNIFTELCREYNTTTSPISGNLEKWAHDGVLLLNSILTVEEGRSRSHLNIGWENFTSAVIRYIDNHNKCVFMAWGKDAQKLAAEQVSNNKILTAGHPSPLNTSNPFVGCNCFREANDLLKSYQMFPIRWLSLF